MSRWGRALLAQALGWWAAIFLLGWPARPGLAALPVALLAGTLAATASLALRDPPWRAPMQAGFALAAWAGSAVVLPAWIWAGALTFSLLVFGGGLTGRRAPLYLTHERAVAAILACLPEDLEGSCCDLGAGLGSFILKIAPARPRLAFVGIERAPLVCLLADLRCRLLGAGRVRLGDLWQTPLQDYAVVYAFLSPEAMDALWAKACREMRAGSLLVVNAFPIVATAPERTERYGDHASDCVYCYRLPPAPP